MSTSLLQEWCAARLGSLWRASERMASQAKSLMTEEGATVQARVHLEAAIIDIACHRHQLTLASLVGEFSASTDLGFTGDETFRSLAADLTSGQADQPLDSSLSRLCDLRATISAVQFSYDELGSAFGVLGLSNYRDDLYWMRDECATYNRRLEALVTSHQAQLVAPRSPTQQVSDESANAPFYPCVVGQIASFHAATEKSVHEAC